MPFPLAAGTRDTIERYFRRHDLAWTEEFFVRVLESSERKHDVYWATIALRECGTATCLDALKAKLHYPMQDVKCTSLLTVAHIAGPSETPLYAAALLDPAYREKGYAMWAIRDAADARAVDAVLAYFRKNRSKLKNGTLVNGTVADGIEYLARYRADPGVGAFLEEVRGVGDRLGPGNVAEIKKRVPGFFAA